MLHPYLPYNETIGFHPLIAAGDPVGSVPDLQPVIHDFERNRARNQRRQQKKHSEIPLPPPPADQKNPDTPNHVDDYA
jgi:hypothetical protein